MKFVIKRAGAVALATILFASGFGAAGGGASAQDQAESTGLEMALIAAQDEVDAPEAAIRFVPSETVQPLPQEYAEAPAAPQADTLSELVAETDTEGQLSPEVTCLAEAIYFESRGEPLIGQLAVAQVIVNRAESAQFPDDYCSVVTQRAQFSFVRGGNIPAPNRGSIAWTRARAIARIAHRGLWESEAGDALYFHARHVRPRWASRLAARATIQNHIFYR